MVLATLGVAGCVSIPEPRLQTQARGFDRAALSPAAIRVLSWNIQKGEAAHWVAPVDDPLFADRDLVLLQEACADDPANAQDQRLADAHLGHVFAASFRSPVLACADDRATGVLSASHVRPRQRVPLPSRHREFGLTPKMSLATWYPIAGTAQRLLVVNAHLLNFEWRSLDHYAEQLADIEAVLARHAGPIILAGDLNSRNQPRQRRIDALARRIGLRAVFDDPSDTRTRARLGGPLALDQIYYRGLILKAAGQIGDEAAAGRSDHNSLSAVFRLADTTRPGRAGDTSRAVRETRIRPAAGRFADPPVAPRRIAIPSDTRARAREPSPRRRVSRGGR